MLIDDEPDIASITARGLRLRGIMVDSFISPQDALDHYKSETYDRIVTNIRMPRISGFELARRIRAHDPNAEFCFMTSFEIQAEEARMVLPNLPDHCFLKKPIAPSELADHLEYHLTDN